MRLLGHSRRNLRVAAVAALAAMAILAACDPAQNGKVDQLTIVGSATTQDVMDLVANLYKLDSTYNKDQDVLWNIHATQAPPVTVPPDANCGSITWHFPPGLGETQSPGGSDAGRDALSQSVQAGNGCVDSARSALPPRSIGKGIGQDLSTFQYFAYALDAVSAATASSRAPTNLTQSQLQGIFNCTVTNWNQVGGIAGPIQRYWPAAGSDTRAFFQSDVLNGFDPTTVSSASCPVVKTTDENTGETIAANGDLETAIVPYTASQWVAQAHGATPDVRDGLRILSLNGQSTVVGDGVPAHLNTAAGPVQESNVGLNNPNPTYPGIHYVFNVLDSTSVAYSQVQYFLGFGTDSGSKFKSPLCNGQFPSLLQFWGFAPLDTTVDATHNPRGSTCRLFKP